MKRDRKIIGWSKIGFSKDFIIGNSNEVSIFDWRLKKKFICNNIEYIFKTYKRWIIFWDRWKDINIVCYVEHRIVDFEL